MTIDDIKALIAPDESRTLELKKTTGELKDGMHAACAFLNTDGGWLIFGIAPKSLKIVGQQVTDATKIEISQALAEIEPAYDIQPIYILMFRNIPAIRSSPFILIAGNGVNNHILSEADPTTRLKALPR